MIMVAWKQLPTNSVLEGVVLCHCVMEGLLFHWSSTASWVPCCLLCRKNLESHLCQPGPDEQKGFWCPWMPNCKMLPISVSLELFTKLGEFAKCMGSWVPVVMLAKLLLKEAIPCRLVRSKTCRIFGCSLVLWLQVWQ